MPRVYLERDRPKIISKPNIPVQIFLQNQGPRRVQIRPFYPQSMKFDQDEFIDEDDSGTFLCSGDILILAFESPAIPAIRVIGLCADDDGVIDVQEWPY